MHLLAGRVGLPSAINGRLKLLKKHLPYWESDHVLNIAYNTMCGGRCLEDIDLRRNDEVFMDGLGAQRIPDPTTAGDFCRRFEEADVEELMEAINDCRLKVWRQQPAEFFRQAIIEADGTVVPTSGECKEGMDFNYHKKTWGYHPLVVSLANLRLIEEEVAEFRYTPMKCKNEYRMVVLRKTIDVERGQELLFTEYDYFFYITNAKAMTVAQVVKSANRRCNQEKLIAQLKSLRSLHSPVDTLTSNWAYMVMASLAWSLKAWYALLLPSTGRWGKKHKAEKNAVLKMEFSGATTTSSTSPTTGGVQPNGSCSSPTSGAPKRS